MSMVDTGIESGGAVGAGVGVGVGVGVGARLGEGFTDGLADGFELGLDEAPVVADGAVDPLAGADGDALGAELGDGLGLAGASGGATRTRCAWVASQLTSLNGPVPIGASLNGSWASAAGPTPSRM